MRLKESAERLDWAGGVDDYISFIIAHQVNEVDIRYRMISYRSYYEFRQWKINTKLSYLNVAMTESASPWTSLSNSTFPTLFDGEDGLYRWTHWVKTSSLPPADHFMLLTGLNLIRDGNISIAGRAFIGGICSENSTSFSEFSSSAIYAHEIGHNLGAYHDGSNNYCKEEDQYVMTPAPGLQDSSTVGHNWIFSACSVRYFDVFLTILNMQVQQNSLNEYYSFSTIKRRNDFANCLLGAGVYIPEWEDRLSGRLRQAMPLDAQCQLAYGKDMYYARSQYDTVCSDLSCTNGNGTAYIYSSIDTLQYTSCGNKKWCEKDVCVYHPDAPALDEGCPFEDKDFPQWKAKCSEVTPWECQKSLVFQLYCCRACRVFATPWLGPNCTHGDTGGSFCKIVVNRTECLYEAEYCCESCCPILGPEEGYSCDQPSPTTTVKTTLTPTRALTTATSKPTAAHTIKKVTTGISGAVDIYFDVLYIRILIIDSRGVVGFKKHKYRSQTLKRTDYINLKV
ncbi:uncharacterized protein [Watersipora subatra]|uniref:uncharacterized protein n=1 Tax=Watersipora subatra TaxID=2589382 RepID=UPI00355C9D38